ncbi:MAG: hypothetical protein LUE87_10640 [Lachnospiraceae bacterium]|nr:hypothetical protein [Lachnospiraceae bacterium]
MTDVKLSSWGGLLSVALVVIFNVSFPMLYAKVIDDAAGWSRLILMLAVPLCIIGFLRFFFIKEVYDVDAHTDKVTFSDIKELQERRESRAIEPSTE